MVLKMNLLTQRQTYLLLGLILVAELFVQLSFPHIYILDEAKNAQCASEMLQTHKIVPTFNGELRTDKPPLHYFFMMLAYSIMGVNSFAARFFSAIMGIATVVFTWQFAKNFCTAGIGVLASLVLILSPQFLFEFRLSVPDPYLIFFVSSGLMSAFAWTETAKIKYLYLSSALLALGCLAKGPVALALPGMILLIWIAINHYWKRFASWHLVGAILLFLIICLPWYIAVHLQTQGEWTKGFFLDNNIKRFSDAQEGHGGFFLLPIIYLFVGLLPFSLLLPQSVKATKRYGKKGSLLRFSALSTLVFILFFCFSSTRLPNYPMPCYPLAAIFFASGLETIIRGEEKIYKWQKIFYPAFFIILSIAGYVALKIETELSNFAILAFLLLIPFAIMVITLIKTPNEESTNYLKGICLSFGIFIMLGLWIIYPVIYSVNPVASSEGLLEGRNPVYAYRNFNPAFRFYTENNIRIFENIEELRDSVLLHPNAIVIGRTEDSTQLKRLPLEKEASYRDLFESPTTLIHWK